MNSWILKLLVKAQDLKDREDGQGLVEYGLIVALVAFGATVAMKALGSGLSHAFTNISSTLAASLT